ncbi:MAG: hypothetical protein ACI3XQ_08280 [Eubacteriales bacterium]
MKQIVIEMNDDEFEQLKSILNDVNIHNVVKMCLKRIVNEESIDFLFSDSKYISNTTPTLIRKPISPHRPALCQNQMGKEQAISIFREHGHYLKINNTTFASINTSVDSYWANPNYSLLKREWALILNDWGKRILYLIIIPPNSIDKSQLVARNDRNAFNIEIEYNDQLFTDKRSGYSFKQFLADEINY